MALRKPKDGGDYLKHCLLFAQVLIVHRFGLADDVVLPKAEVQPAPVGIGALTFKTVRPAERRKATRGAAAGVSVARRGKAGRL